MYNKLKITSAAALLALSVGAQADFIDLFTDPVFQEVDTDGLAVGTVVEDQNSVSESTILGGYRDLIIVENTDTSPVDGGGVGSGDATIAVGSGVLSFSSSDGVTATGKVQWDGDDSGSIGTLDRTGLQVGGVGENFRTQDGCPSTGCDRFVFEVITSDLDWAFTIGIYTDDDNWTEFDLVATSTIPGGSYTSEILFAFFEDASLCGTTNINPGVLAMRCGDDGMGTDQTADLNNVGAMELVFNIGSTASVDFSIGGITKVPEPGTLGLLGLGLAAAGLVVVRRRRSDKTLLAA